MFDFSHCYCRLPSEISNRLDALYNDTIFDVVEQSIRKSPYEFLRLGQVVTFKRESRNPLEAPEEEFTYVDIGSVNTIKGQTEPEKMIGRDAKSSRMRRVIHKGDLLVSTTRPTRNAICVVPDELDSQICSTGFAVLEAKPEVLPKFLFYALRCNLSTLQFEKYCSGSGYPAINQETDLPKILVPKPDKKAQETIIARLRPLEIEAEQLERNARQARAEADNALLIELGFEQPDRANYFFKSGAEKQSVAFFQFASDLTDRLHFLYHHPKYTYLSELTKKYQTVTLKSICREPIHRGEQVKEDESGIYLLLKTVHLKSGYIDFDNAARISAETFDSNAKAQVQKGDILLTSTGYVSIGKVDIYDRDLPALVDGHISIIRLNDDYDPFFVAYFLRSHLGQLQIEKWWTGSSGQIELPQTDIAKFTIISCENLPRKKQTQIADRITTKLVNAQDLEKKAREKRDEAKRIFEQFILGHLKL